MSEGDFFDCEILLAKCDTHGELLELENAALWAFVAAYDEEIEALIAYGRWDESTEPEAQSQLTKRVLVAKDQMTATRKALREYRP